MNHNSNPDYNFIMNPEDFIGDWIDKKCPKCNAQLLGNKVGDEWCSHVECNYGCEDMYKELDIQHGSDLGG